MHAKDLIVEIDKKIKDKSILKHPFYQDWQMGKLTMPMLRIYAKQYYKHVAAFPLYLSAVHTKISNFNDRKLILQNLIDEESGQNNHIELWLRFGEALGLAREGMEKTIPLKETTAFVNHFKSATSQKSMAEGIAALYAYESQIPKVSEEKIKGLINFYGIDNEQGLEYFKVHMQADVEHSRAESELITKYANDEEMQKNVLEAVDQTLDAYWSMLSGIHRACKQSC